jgi:hypothetical protein
LLHKGGKKIKADEKGRVRKDENYGYTNGGCEGFVLERTMNDGSDEMRWMSSGGWYSGDLTRMRMKNERRGNERIESGVGDSTQY